MEADTPLIHGGHIKVSLGDEKEVEPDTNWERFGK